MAKIIFERWLPGMRKIPFINLLREKGGLSLTDAKRLKDKLVDNDEIVEIEVQGTPLAEEVLNESKELGVQGRIEP